MKLWFAFILALFAALPQAKACSSCGSGGADPLVLFPYENLKLLGQLTQQHGFRDIAYDASQSRSYGPEKKWLLTTSMAVRLTQKAFASLTLPWHRHQRADKEATGFGDPLLTVRYNLLQQNLLQIYRPQVQFIAAHKKSRSRSIHGSRRFDNLDVRSNGFDESIFGIDLWFGMSSWIGGATYLWTAPTSLEHEFGKVERAAEHRGIITFGYQWEQKLSLIGGWRIRHHSGLRFQGKAQEHSSVEEGSWFVTAETRLPIAVNYRFTVSEAASRLDSKQANTARFWSISLAAIGRLL
ncbi:MAG: hypothetical protein ACOH5I_10255 [Oligoflexus sp.]